MVFEHYLGWRTTCAPIPSKLPLAPKNPAPHPAPNQHFTKMTWGMWTDGFSKEKNLKQELERIHDVLGRVVL